MNELLRRLPKVDQLLEIPRIQGLMTRMPRSVVVWAVRESIEERRQLILTGQIAPDLPESADNEDILDRITVLSEEKNRPHFCRTVNATGVIVHTNLGRSLMATESLEAIAVAGKYFSNLEFDLKTGQRGSRYSHVEGLLCELTGAEAGLVVNNNAAAVFLCLDTLARDRQVVVSRGELVEIGGSFRIPDVMAKSGAFLVEVGTTNKTHLYDYEKAINENTALILKVHQSNFRIIGFTQLVDIKDLVSLAHERDLPVAEDLGSGSMVDLSRFGLHREPTVRETIASGVDVTTFSGDKLLGGPQAGIILGQKQYIDRIKKNPTNRAMRIDKFTLASLEATLRLYRDEATAIARIPTLRLIAASYESLKNRAARLKRKLKSRAPRVAEYRLIDGFSRIGGGASPEEGLKTCLVTLAPRKHSVNQLETYLRNYTPPIIGRIEQDRLVLDVRTMNDDDFIIVVKALADLEAGENT
jgi:L-seryl-tRNA(Ser) seleniumtransferase